jgi:hypothetical protein
MEEILTGRVNFVTTPTRIGLILIVLTMVLGVIGGLLVYTSGVTHVVNPEATPYESYAPYIKAGLSPIATNNTGLLGREKDTICLIVPSRTEVGPSLTIALRAIREAYLNAGEVPVPSKYTINFVMELPDIGLIKVGSTLVTGAEIEYMGYGGEAALRQVLNGCLERNI